MGARGTQPSFTQLANVASALVTAANTNSDGTGNITTPTMYVAFTAGGNGSYVEMVRLMAVASAASTPTSPTTMRIYVSTVGAGATTSANTYLVAEIALPAITADAPTAATNAYDVPLGFAIPAGTFILVSSHVAAAANTGIRATVFGGDY